MWQLNGNGNCDINCNKKINTEITTAKNTKT